MLSFRAGLGIVLTAALFSAPAFATHSHKAPATRHSTHKTHARSHRVSRRSVRRVRGQQAIESERVTQIQQALVREHYLSNDDANGKWDTTTQSAMQKFQADNGWQTKLMPDSRALKKLGLGPDYSDAINARTSSFNDPPPISSIPAQQAAGFADAAGTASAAGGTD